MIHRRVKLMSHESQIREYVSAGRSDEWIAVALGSTSASVQSFRSRRSIYRRGNRPVAAPGTEAFEGVIETGAGVGIWLDPEIAEGRAWGSWRDVSAVEVVVLEDRIVILPAAE